MSEGERELYTSYSNSGEAWLRRNPFSSWGTIKQTVANWCAVQVSDTTMLNKVVQLVKKKRR